MLAKEEIISAIEDRTQFYTMLSKLYAWPLEQGEIDSIDVDALKQLSAAEENELMADGLNDIYRFLRRKNTGTRQVLNADYTRVFLGRTAYEGLTAQPYASLFLSVEPHLMGEERMVVNQIYKKNQIKLSSGIDIPEDHLAFECEFMTIIGNRCVQMLEEENSKASLEQLEIQLMFVQDHILNWFDRFFALSNKLIETRFYRGVLKLSKGFFESEPKTIEKLIEDVISL